MEDKEAVTGKRTLLPIHAGSDGPDILNPYREPSSGGSQGSHSTQAGPSPHSKQRGKKDKNS